MPPESGPVEGGALHAQQATIAAHLRDPRHAPPPAGFDARRLALYARLCRNNLDSLLATNFPVLRALHDTAAWDERVRAFQAGHPCRTPFFHRLGAEFVEWLRQRADDSGEPPYFAELAHYEWSELALALDEACIEDVAHDADGDVARCVPVVSPLAQVHAYRYPVHRIGPAFQPSAPSAQPVLLLLVRDRLDAVRFLELDPLTALLLERLAANTTRSGVDCVADLLATLGRDTPPLRASGIEALARLRACDALLGTRIF